MRTVIEFFRLLWELPAACRAYLEESEDQFSKDRDAVAIDHGRAP